MSRPCLSHAAEQTPVPRFPTARPLALAVHLIVFGGAFALAAHAPEAFAQSSPQATATRAYDIPAGPLSSALVRFAREAGVSLVGAGNAADGKSSPGLKGSYTVQGGFAALLAGSGLEAFRQADGSYGLRSAPVVDKSGEAVLATVTVSAGRDPGDLPPVYAGGQVARGGRVGMLGNKDVMDTPFNQTNYTAEFIENSGAQTLTDVLVNDPSVGNLAAPSAGLQIEGIRGFSQGDGTNAIALNGLYGILPYWQLADVSFAERVEVLKGPSALLNGMPVTGAVGGSVNIVSKQAPLEPVAKVGVGYSTNSKVRATADLSRRFGEGKEFGIQLNATQVDGEGPIKSNDEKLTSALLGLDYTSERVRISANLGMQNRDFRGTSPSIGLGNNQIPSVVPDNSRGFFPSWTRRDTEDTFGMIHGEFDISENLSAYAAYGLARNDSDLTFPAMNLSNVNGNFSPIIAYQRRRVETSSALAGLRYLLETGPVHHTINVNWSQLNQDYDWSTKTVSFPLVSNIYNPINFAEPAVSLDPMYRWTQDRRSSVGVADTLAMFNDRLQITVGARRQTAAREQFSATGTKTTDYESSVWSPAYTLLVKPIDNVAVYANYIEGLQLGAVVASNYQNSGEVFPPYQSKQYEAGVKVDWSNRLMTTLAVFQIKQPNAISIPSSTTGQLPTLALDGEVQNKGVELNLFGEPITGFRLNGGVTYLDSTLSKTQGGLNEGNQAPGAPKYRATLGAEWDAGFVPGLTFSARVRYTDKVYVDNANTKIVDAWTLWDAGARYRFTSSWGKPAVVRLSITNLFDKNFWVAGTTWVSLPTPRTVNLSASFDF